MAVSDHLQRLRSLAETEGHTSDIDEHSREEHVADAVARGIQGGFVATLIMTAFRLPLLRSLPPSANFWSQYVAGGDPDDHTIPGLALHLLYGVSSGAVFGVLFSCTTPADRSSPNSADSSGARSTAWPCRPSAHRSCYRNCSISASRPTNSRSFTPATSFTAFRSGPGSAPDRGRGGSGTGVRVR